MRGDGRFSQRWSHLHIYTHVLHMWNTKMIVKELQRELINYSTVTIHRQEYDLVV